MVSKRKKKKLPIIPHGLNASLERVVMSQAVALDFAKLCMPYLQRRCMIKQVEIENTGYVPNLNIFLPLKIYLSGVISV